MQAVETILYYVNVIGFLIIITLLIAAAVFYYFLKVKKITAKVEKIDNTNFRRKDAASYVRFKDIVSSSDTLDSPGMIVLPGNYFVGAVKIKGFNYNSSAAREKLDAAVNSVAFFNLVEEGVTFRRNVKSIDLSENINLYGEIIKDIAKELLELDEEYRATVAAAEDNIGDIDTYAVYEEKIKALQRSIFAKNHMLEECQNVVGYMQAMSGDMQKNKNAAGEKVSHMLFSYTYNPDDFNETLSKEEIYLKALEKLDMKAKSYSQGMAYCHFKTKTATGRDLFALMYQHTHPLSGDVSVIDEVLNSSYTSMFVSSDSLVDLQRQKIGEEIFEKEMEEYNKRLDDLLKSQETELNRQKRMIEERSYAEAYREMTH